MRLVELVAVGRLALVVQQTQVAVVVVLEPTVVVE
jgi:hypothetical protein